MLSAQNTVLPLSNADLHGSRSPELPVLSSLAILDIARLYKADPENALALADESRRAYEAGRGAPVSGAMFGERGTV